MNPVVGSVHGLDQSLHLNIFAIDTRHRSPLVDGPVIPVQLGSLGSSHAVLLGIGFGRIKMADHGASLVSMILGPLRLL